MFKKLGLVFGFIALLVLMELVLFNFMQNEYERKKLTYLSTLTQEWKEEYTSVIGSYKKVTDAIFQGLISNGTLVDVLNIANKNKEFLKTRDLLLTTFDGVNKTNKANSISIFQIHDAKGYALVRFQKPSAYGDNVLSYLKIITAVHESKKMAQGFEGGQFFNAYRYVYPVLNSGELSGSVQLGFQESELNTELKKTFQINSYMAIEQSQNVIRKEDVGESPFSTQKVKLLHHVKSYPSEQQKLINQLLSPHRKELSNAVEQNKELFFSTEANGTNYAVVCRPIFDFAGNFTGYVALFSSDKNLPLLKKEFIISVTLGIMLTFVLWGVIAAMFFRYYRTKKELDKNRVEQNVLLSNLQEGVLTVDSQGVCTYVNESALAILGFEKDEIVGSIVHDLIHHSTADGLKKHREECPVCMVINDGVATAKEDLFFKKDGSQFPIYLSAAPLMIENGQHGAVAIFQDISENKRILRDLEELNQRLEQKVNEQLEESRQKDLILHKQARQASLGEMISNIAHQWRQPINALAIMIQDIPMAVEYGEFNDKYMEELNKDAMRIINYMSQTIDDFRNFFKSDEQKKSFDIFEAILSVLAIFEGQFNHDHIVTTVECTADCGSECNLNDKTPVSTAKKYEKCRKGQLFIEGLENEFKQVVINILSNARYVLIERNIKNKEVAFRILDEDDSFAICISDNAGGIDNDVLGRIFEPYFTTKGTDGTGIGLYMCKMMIEKNMAGKLTAQNIDGGAEFKIVLPKKS